MRKLLDMLTTEKRGDDIPRFTSPVVETPSDEPSRSPDVEPVVAPPPPARAPVVRPPIPKPGYSQVDAVVLGNTDGGAIAGLNNAIRGLLVDMATIANSSARPADELSAIARRSIERHSGAVR